MSRLLDVCRQCIVFEDLAGLAACLDALAGDPDIVVVQVGEKSGNAVKCRCKFSIKQRGRRECSVKRTGPHGWMLPEVH